MAACKKWFWSNTLLSEKSEDKSNMAFFKSDAARNDVEIINKVAQDKEILEDRNEFKWI